MDTKTIEAGSTGELMDSYECSVCHLIQDDDEDFEETCPQCGTPDQFYLIE
jgi:rubredoxin